MRLTQQQFDRLTTNMNSKQKPAQKQDKQGDQKKGTIKGDRIGQYLISFARHMGIKREEVESEARTAILRPRVPGVRLYR